MSIIKIGGLTKSEQYDVVSGRIFGLFLCLHAVNIAFQRMSIGSTLSLKISLTLLFVSSIVFAHKYLRKAFTIFVFTEIAFGFLVMSTILYYPKAWDSIILKCLRTIVIGIPLYAIGRCVRDYRLFFSQTVVPSLFSLVIAASIFIFNYTQSVPERYSMSVGYLLLYPALVFIYYARRKKCYLIPFFISLLIILSYGSRGPLIGIGGYLIICFFSQKGNGQTVFKRFALLLFISIISINALHIGSCFIDLLSHFNIHSRTLSLMLREDMLHGSGRIIVYQYFLDAISRSPVFGHGMAAWVAEFGYYPHNVFLELFYSFGCILGLIISLIVLVKVFYGLFFADARSKDCFQVLIMASFPMLLISGTFINSPIFCLMLGIVNTRIKVHV